METAEGMAGAGFWGETEKMSSTLRGAGFADVLEAGEAAREGMLEEEGGRVRTGLGAGAELIPKGSSLSKIELAISLLLRSLFTDVGRNSVLGFCSTAGRLAAV